ncbi:MAG: SufS family cysteine desulfurase [Sphaerotilus natans subsp. sulfidivorans]|uniref:family 2A encapsulin nanocompartment cargo protein cysteine desulfurase n=1 Tax=Sphaerotilus sulfidivorans TaxID=639200 RepID=UPI002354726E|nr:family 2A encapsulin nanocompartment cargo protein cysteine desulfurase [Sphaerotilus sulfidivorans]MCK6403241.1 SufS family cysteine desulfurase [Sphaerotilus sulfidivorans]
MTTLTPTSELSPGGSAAEVPAGLPDVATLARLAGEFFAALPNGAVPQPPSGVGLPSGLSGIQGLSAPAALPSPANAASGAAAQAAGSGGSPTSAHSAQSTPSPHALSLGKSSPALVPNAAASNGLPEQAAVGAPGAVPRAGGQALGVPEAYAPALPSVPSAPANLPVPSTPYYFLGEASTLPSAVSGPSFYFAPPAGSGSSAFDPTVVPTPAASARPPFDVHAIRRDFPILQERVNGRQLVWFDNAATTHKPQSVIDRIAWFYAHENSNIHRAAHELAARATDAYESARQKVARFIGAGSVEEIIFVRGATEAINLVAKTWGTKNVGEGDEIIVSNLEHHANIVPWQQLAAEKGAKLRVIPVDDSGQVLLEEYKRLLNDRTKIVSVTQVSNALGTVVPVAEIVDLAHRAGAVALVDGAQSVSHMRVNVREIGADFFVFSGHKVFGPTGIGVVYGKRELLEDMPPWQGGGNMIADVTFERTVFQPPPNKFEAGTGNIADAVGLGAAIDYVERIGMENIARYEHDLLVYATRQLQPIPGVRLIGTARDKASVLSFVLKGYTTEEVGKALNQEGIAVRSGHHCAQPILRRFGVEATVRPSLAFYNTCEEVDALIRVVQRLSGARR